MSAADVITQDIAAVLQATPPAAWERLRGQRIFLTGGTGFLGKWLLHALAGAEREHRLGLAITVLTRDAKAFAEAHPALASLPMVRWLEGGVTDFTWPTGAHDLLIHAALPVGSGGDASLVTTSEQGTLNVCRFAAQARVRRLLHISSGAVHGPATTTEPFIESMPFAGDSVNAYTQAKRAAEQVLQVGWPFEIVVARCFAFMGPFQTPDSGSAPAQFIAAAAEGQAIQVRGSGASVRSYQYASDMARWLLVLLALAPAGSVCNVGSDEQVSVLQLARRVASASGAAVEVLGQAETGLAGSFYVPSLAFARQALGLVNTVPLDEAVRRTLTWRTSAVVAESVR